jgi:glycosyltransferase involved in cell wall biosynthesis
MTRVAVVIVTSDSARWLPATLASIAGQTRLPEDLVAVDDGSTDGTVDLLRAAGADVVQASTTSPDVITRIAQNFVQGVRSCPGADIVVLGDHDDVWHADRIAHQVGILETWHQALMVASDGVLVDADGRPTGGTLRTAFPVTPAWDELTPANRMRMVLRSSVATGGASAIRPHQFPELDVPPGWLHDRWWSLVATGRNGMIIDRDEVIDYRVQPGQQLGLDAGAQRSGGIARMAALIGQGARARRKARDLRSRLRPLIDDPDVAAVVSLRSVLTS